MAGEHQHVFESLDLPPDAIVQERQVKQLEPVILKRLVLWSSKAFNHAIVTAAMANARLKINTGKRQCTNLWITGSGKSGNTVKLLE
jgi:hypothetical protein